MNYTEARDILTKHDLTEGLLAAHIKTAAHPRRPAARVRQALLDILEALAAEQVHLSTVAAVPREFRPLDQDQVTQ